MDEAEDSTVGAYEAKTKLPQLLERVRRGERITITKHGVPVARLVPVAAGQRPLTVEQAIEGLLAFQQRHPLDGLGIRELIDEGRRT